MINPCNDVELCKWRAVARDAYKKLDHLTAEGKQDALWLEYYRLRNAADKALERLNRLKWPNKEAA